MKNPQMQRQKSCTILLSTLVFGSLVSQSHAGWVDPDTKKKDLSTKPLVRGDERQFELVFSDEFEQEGRRFGDGADPRWTALNKNDYTNDALQYYSPDNAVTTNGVLNISTIQKDNSYKAFDEEKKVYYADQKHIQSAMLQGWNKFCFTGGIIEFSAKLPGDPKVGGLWPALWMLGNLARATYVGSSDFVWPFSYNMCDQRNRKAQEINACSRVNHFGLDEYRGRGSPEVDIIEAMQGEAGHLPNTIIQRPYQSTSLQVAPGIEIDRPSLGHRPHKDHWYTGLEYGNDTKTKVDLNPFFYGVTMVHKQKGRTYQADALSANLQLNTTHYERQHTYRVEWEPPAEDGTGGYLKWFTDGHFVYGFEGEVLSLMQTEIPSEPMYLLMNTAISSKWGFPSPCPEGCDCDCFECGNPACACALPPGYCKNFPASFEIDYVRVYQAVNDSRHILGCSPENRPTAQFIKGHAKRYMEEGDKRPLLDVQRGGASCDSDKECGSGSCSSGYCVCGANFTGPNCLAHDGFYDVDTSKPIPEFFFSKIMIPRSLYIVIAILTAGFVASMVRTKTAKSKESKYQKLSNSGNDDGGGVQYTAANTSYQNTTVSNYAMPPQQKVNTYCVIDSRLVDP